MTLQEIKKSSKKLNVFKAIYENGRLYIMKNGKMVFNVFCLIDLAVQICELLNISLKEE